ncbi:DUF4040 domain-containing protein [Methylonatrum kenyense]|uniref:hydrogenase subunit MbhD domain-containing protein n=1 Tax=Methylonatrum kenyense TaxID=455253 RepID=UPI0020BF8C48|nr:hydrogenase subunit MbhD domain-containing protein [Methylonatrum kenyense]MCK8517064.1 DUF4040 domain-containing protein [Methylonatrum kenyense]
MMLLDGVLALLLLLLAGRCVTAASLLQAIVAFIVLGLLLALSWVRLQAPDLALAEAAIGAGLLGVLLLGTWRHLPASGIHHEFPWPWHGMKQAVSALGGLALAVMLALALHETAPEPAAAGETALAQLDAAGVKQPVTAVLLNFRAYDTLLEMGVLLMALIGALIVRRPLQDGSRIAPATLLSPSLARLFLPPILLIGLYLVWAGAYSPGGAFQGGAVLAGAGVMLALTGLLRGASVDGLWLRGLLALGAIVFTTAGVLLVPVTGHFMAYPDGLVTPLMVLIEFSLAISIALSLLLLFTGTPGLARSRP